MVALCPSGVQKANRHVEGDFSVDVLAVRNTFIDLPTGVPRSLVGFFQEREVRSCPVSGVCTPVTDGEGPVLSDATLASDGQESVRAVSPDAAPYKLDDMGLPEYDYPVGALILPSPVAELASSSVSCGQSVDLCKFQSFQSLDFDTFIPTRADDCVSVGDEGSHAACSAEVPIVLPEVLLLPSIAPMWPPAAFANNATSCPQGSPPQDVAYETYEHCAFLGEQSKILRIADAISPTAPLGGALLPSLGSAGHHRGKCKPCVHYHKTGCLNGAECPFCHLCGPNAVKMRQKARARYIDQRKRVRAGRRSAAAAAVASDAMNA